MGDNHCATTATLGIITIWMIIKLKKSNALYAKVTHSTPTKLCFCHGQSRKDISEKLQEDGGADDIKNEFQEPKHLEL